MSPRITCPRPDCRSTRTRIRYVKWSTSRQRFIRHRVCLKCEKRFRTSIPKEEYEGLDIAV